MLFQTASAEGYTMLFKLHPFGLIMSVQALSFCECAGAPAACRLRSYKFLLLQGAPVLQDEHTKYAQ